MEEHEKGNENDSATENLEASDDVIEQGVEDAEELQG